MSKPPSDKTLPDSGTHATTLTGPLGEMFPALKGNSETLPFSPVHARALRHTDEAGGDALTLCCWDFPEQPQALHTAIRERLEAALLVRLAHPPEDASSLDPLSAVQLVCTTPAPYDPAPALAAFGLRALELPGPDRMRLAALVRAEAGRLEQSVSQEILQVYACPSKTAQDPMLEKVITDLHGALAGKPWGEQPGHPARALAEALERAGGPHIEPSPEGIDSLERLIFSTDAGVLRWLQPGLFQALCDLVALTGHAHFGRNIQWGVCEPEEPSGQCPPPVIRIDDEDRQGHIPLGQHILQWCVMPRRPDETVPSLGEWASHEFGS